MLEGIKTLATISKMALPWLKFLEELQRELSEDEKIAVEALLNALTETKIYVGQLQRSEVKQDDQAINFEKEADLSRLWTQASSRLRGINPELAERCLIKSSYWTNPENWNNEQVKEACIGLDQMFEEATSLLHKKAFA